MQTQPIRDLINQIQSDAVQHQHNFEEKQEEQCQFCPIYFNFFQFYSQLNLADGQFNDKIVEIKRRLAYLNSKVEIYNQNLDYTIRYQKSNKMYQKQADLNLLIQEHSNLQDQVAMRQSQLQALQEKFNKHQNQYIQFISESQAIMKVKQQDIENMFSKIKVKDNSELDLSFETDTEHIEIVDIQKLHQLINKQIESNTNLQRRQNSFKQLPLVDSLGEPSDLFQSHSYQLKNLPPIPPQKSTLKSKGSVQHMICNQVSEKLSSQFSFNSTELTDNIVSNSSLFQGDAMKLREELTDNSYSNKVEAPVSTHKLDTLDMEDINVDFYFDEL